MTTTIVCSTTKGRKMEERKKLHSVNTNSNVTSMLQFHIEDNVTLYIMRNFVCTKVEVYKTIGMLESVSRKCIQ